MDPRLTTEQAAAEQQATQSLVVSWIPGEHGGDLLSRLELAAQIAKMEQLNPDHSQRRMSVSNNVAYIPSSPYSSLETISPKRRDSFTAAVQAATDAMPDAAVGDVTDDDAATETLSLYEAAVAPAPLAAPSPVKRDSRTFLPVVFDAWNIMTSAQQANAHHLKPAKFPLLFAGSAYWSECFGRIQTRASEMSMSQTVAVPAVVLNYSMSNEGPRLVSQLMLQQLADNTFRFSLPVYYKNPEGQIRPVDVVDNENKAYCYPVFQMSDQLCYWDGTRRVALPETVTISDRGGQYTTVANNTLCSPLLVVNADLLDKVQHRAEALARFSQFFNAAHSIVVSNSPTLRVNSNTTLIKEPFFAKASFAGDALWGAPVPVAVRQLESVVMGKLSQHPAVNGLQALDKQVAAEIKRLKGTWIGFWNASAKAQDLQNAYGALKTALRAEYGDAPAFYTAILAINEALINRKALPEQYVQFSGLAEQFSNVIHRQRVSSVSQTRTVSNLNTALAFARQVVAPVALPEAVAAPAR